jgi:hypothetical protein
MKRLFAAVVFMLGSVTALAAQQAPSVEPETPLATAFGYAPMFAVNTDSVTPGTPVIPMADPSVRSEVAEPVPAVPANPAPPPDPKFLYGGRDDYRWQLGLGVSWERFRSSVFNASAVGLNTSIAYYTNDWLGIEGNLMTGFAPTIFDHEHVKLFNLTGGPKIAWRQRRWEPWVHGLVGFSHEQPQTAFGGRNAFAAQVGGGADYRINPRLSARLQGDWLHTQFFSQSQNNITLAGSLVIHF